MTKPSAQTTEPDANPITARWLQLLIENDAQTYRQATAPAIKNLCRKIAAGSYDRERAALLWEHVARRGAQAYARQFASGSDWPVIFPVPVRKVCAVLLRDAFEREYDVNQYGAAGDGLNPVPVKRRPTCAVRREAWRVVYGETMPTWERLFPTQVEAVVFARRHETFGDVIFSIAKVVPGEEPQSLTAALSANANRREGSA